MTAVAPGATVSPVELACPACHGSLGTAPDALVCGRCRRRFSVVAGIPDLRLAYPDAYLSWEEDVERAAELAERFENLDFVALLRAHWVRSGKPPELVERFVAGDVASIERSKVYLAAIERERGAALDSADRFLEIGCGTAGLAAAAALQGVHAVASDVSLRWLVLAKKRLLEAGIEGVELVCCAAEKPPFPPNSFDVVGASDVIEHVVDQGEFVRGCGELLRPGGFLFLATPNRFSLSLEPHVRLWGVGFLPRPIARRYVRVRRKTPYEHVRLLSASALRRLLTRNGFAPKIVPPEIPPATEEMYAGLERRLVRTYNRLRHLAPVRLLLLAAGPFFHVFARKGAG
jgi:2-polyprenyl-3-methyl-5-hydroxy-6-metoxy-1,4-benzoquinol methylase/uncharacterized protein YbaR (Trm112 family)